MIMSSSMFFIRSAEALQEMILLAEGDKESVANAGSLPARFIPSFLMLPSKETTLRLLVRKGRAGLQKKSPLPKLLLKLKG